MRVRGPDIHHGPGFLQSWGWAGHEAGYQMRMSDMWWLISLITTHSATSYNHSVYYQEWWVQLESQESNEPLSAILIQFSRPESDLKDVGPILNFRNSHIPASQWWSTGAGFLSDLIKFGLRAKYGHRCILGPVWSYPGHDGEWGHWMFAWARIIIALGRALGNFTIYHREQCSVFAKLSSNISTRIVRLEYTSVGWDFQAPSKVMRLWIDFCLYCQIC